MDPGVIAAGLVLTGTCAVAIGLWGLFAWPAAVLFIGAAAMTAGLAEIFDWGTSQ